jgi:hypothetical protein
VSIDRYDVTVNKFTKGESMTIKIFDLEQDLSLLVELEEKDMNKVCGGAGGTGEATQITNEEARANRAAQSANAANAKNFQDTLTAVKNDANFAMKAEQLSASLVEGIKV